MTRKEFTAWMVFLFGWSALIYLSQVWVNSQ